MAIKVMGSHFSYCPFIWMFLDRAKNNRIHKIHERALQITYRDTESSFDERLAIDNSIATAIENVYSQRCGDGINATLKPLVNYSYPTVFENYPN